MALLKFSGAVAAMAVGILIASQGPDLNAQKGGKPVSKPATGTFRCPGPDCPVADPAVLTDGIRGDQFSFSYTSTDGAAIDTLGEFSLRLVPNGRSLFLDFSNGLWACGSACRRTFTTLQIDSTHSTVFHTNVIDPVTGGEAGNGLLSIPVGATWKSRLKIAFNTVGSTGDTIQWAVRFNPRDYYPSDHISVFRRSSDAWEVFATSDDRAMLASTCCRQRGTTNEGLYAMPFRLYVTTP